MWLWYHSFGPDQYFLPRDEIAGLVVPAAATFPFSGPFSFLRLIRKQVEGNRLP